MDAAQAASFGGPWEEMEVVKRQEKALWYMKTQVAVKEGPLSRGVNSGKFPLPHALCFPLGNHGSVSAWTAVSVTRVQLSHQKSAACGTRAGAASQVRGVTVLSLGSSFQTLRFLKLISGHHFQEDFTDFELGPCVPPLHSPCSSMGKYVPRPSVDVFDKVEARCLSERPRVRQYPS